MIEQARYLNATEAVTKGGIYFVFLTNPDGAEIVLDGIDSVPCDITKQYLVLANNGFDFSQYKANVNLVDLNTNFDADWGTGGQNVRCPSTEDFIGFYPNSEREVISLIDFTRQVKPSLTISYHSKGEIIFYGFQGQSAQDFARDRAIGEQLSATTGYPLVLTENSAGGYKDWCIRVLGIPSYTIEVGDVNLPHPITDENLPEIFAQNKDVPLVALNSAIEYQNQINVQNTKTNNTQKTPPRKMGLFNLFRR